MKYEQLKQIRHVALDLDGTIYTDDQAFPEALHFLKAIQSAGISRTFVTNNCSRSRDDYLTKLHKMGIDAAPEEVYSSAHATIKYLQLQYSAVQDLFIVGTQSLVEEFQRHGFNVVNEDHTNNPDAVVVGFDPDLPFSQLCKASYWISQQVPYFATHPDKVCPTKAKTVLLDCGSICAAIRSATGREPLAIPGKPNPEMLSGILTAHRLRPDQLAMVGDRIYTDMAMAQAADVLSVLVLTGEATESDAQQTPNPPDYVVDTIADFGELLLHSRSSST